MSIWGGGGTRGWWEINDLSKSVPHNYRGGLENSPVAVGDTF